MIVYSFLIKFNSMSINLDSLVTIKAPTSKQFDEWLNHQDPLTDKLKKITGDAQLGFISQQWVHSGWWNKQVLNISDKKVLQREIIMKSHNIAYWYARSIIPQKCYDLDPTFFDRLNNESLKSLIFGEDRVVRLNRICYPIDQQCLEFHWVKNILNFVEGILWVRLAEFSFHKKESFYLAEVFLPDIGNIVS